MTKEKLTYLATEVLDKIWIDWLRQQDHLTDNERRYIQYGYKFHQFNRRGNKVQRFEQWLFTQGAEIRKQAGKFYLEFVDPTNATMLALRWS